LILSNQHNEVIMPKVKNSQIVAESKIFTIESLNLEFDNGEHRTYERVKARGQGAVVVVAITDDKKLVLVKEYAAGTNSYELGFTKGLIDPGESIIQSANRELKEEVGFGANQLRHLQSLCTSPGYIASQIEVVLATELFEEKLPGDEPEELELVYWPLDDYQALLQQNDFNDARCYAALFLVLEYLRSQE